MALAISINCPEDFKMSIFKRMISLLLVAGTGAGILAQTDIICSGAELYSKPNQGVRYGRWEIRMQAAATPGSVSSFFTYFDSSYISGQPWREIDIEVLGNASKGFQSNVILASGSNAYKAFHDLQQDVNSKFQTYALDWTPDSVVWRVDGALIRKESRSAVVTKLKEKDQSYRMNLWSSNSPDWVGTLDLSKLPVYQVVNWMRYSSYTPGAGPNGSNFTESWIDDFNTFNTARWAKGDWTFEGNQAQFTAKNLVVKNGYLVLALTKPDAEGVTGTVPTDPLGSAYQPSGILGKGASSSAWKANATGRGIHVDGWVASNGALEVRDVNGAQVASVRSLKPSFEVPVARSGVFVVRAGDRTVTVVR
ncbi:MAG: family 16 glycosylhydrolase [Fibrobacterota bacterium]